MILLSLAAGKYGAFIWPAYGISFVGFAWMIVDTMARARRWRRAVARQEATQIQAESGA